VKKISEVVAEYKKRLQGMPFMLRSSYGCAKLQEDGGLNQIILTYLFCDQAITILFLSTWA
jgi:hypothetical protein